MVRSEADVKDVHEIFLETGDDPPAMNTPIRDTLTWVLGGISTEELIRNYLVMGVDYQCFTCPAGTTVSPDLDTDLSQQTHILEETHIELVLLLLNAADRILQRLLATGAPSPQTKRVADERQ